MPENWVWFSVVAPWWRVPFRPVPFLGGQRRWVRWRVVKHTRPQMVGELAVSGHEDFGSHWTYRAAKRAADAAQQAARHA